MMMRRPRSDTLRGRRTPTTCESDIVQRVPLFGGFSEAELRRVAEQSRIVELPAGTAVTRIGEPGDSFFVIIDGMVAVETSVETGNALHPGDFLAR